MKLYLTRLIPDSDNIEIALKKFRSFYQGYCKSEHFIDKVKKPCLEYFEYKCFVCGEKAITAHHSKTGYLHLWQEKIPKHVIATCQGCHAILHDKIKPYSRNPKTINNIQPNIDVERLKSISIVVNREVFPIIKNKNIDLLLLKKLSKKVN